jgi:hypothetical protein
MHTPLPAVPNQGGPVLASPAVVTITFANDPNRALFEAYGRWIVGSSWLTTVGAEYGVGAGTTTMPVERTENAPTALASTDIENMLAQGITDGSIPTPPGGLSNAVYMVYYPRGTVVTESSPGHAPQHVCTDVLGYHYEVHRPGLDFAYAVIVDCNVTQIHGLTPLEVEEETASHELIEAASNPFTVTNPGWVFGALDTSAWAWFASEIGDLCARPHVWIREGGYVAQRIWSNAAATAGLDPCIPADPTSPYYNTDAQPSDIQMATAGQTLTFNLTGWSLGPVTNWTVVPTPQGTFQPTFTPAMVTLNNGGTATLRVTVPTTAPRGSYSLITLQSAINSTNYHTAPIGIYVP